MKDANPIARRLSRERIPGLEPDVGCARCGEPTRVSTGSYFTSDVVCLDCRALEELHPAHEAAKLRELEAVKSGDYNFVGIGLPADWTDFVAEHVALDVFDFFSEAPLRTAYPESIAEKLGLPIRFVRYALGFLLAEKSIVSFSYSNRPASYGLNSEN